MERHGTPCRSSAAQLSAPSARSDRHSIQHRLEQEVGSHALMAGSGFERKDMLLCCRFAEGDSRVLKMKMARDRLGTLRRRGLAAELTSALGGSGSQRAESRLALKLGRAMEGARREGGGAVARVWDEQWETVCAPAKTRATVFVDAPPRHLVRASRHAHGTWHPATRPYAPLRLRQARVPP